MTGGALHIEPGIWVRQPATTSASGLVAPPSGDDKSSLIMAPFPTATPILAKGTAQKFTGPAHPADGEPGGLQRIELPVLQQHPVPVGGAIFAAGHSEFKSPPRAAPGAPAWLHPIHDRQSRSANPRTPFGNVPAVPFPAEIDGVLIQDVVNDPITLLQAVVARQLVDGYAFEGVALNIASHTTIQFGATPNVTAPTVSFSVTDGDEGIENIPVLKANATLRARLCDVLDRRQSPIRYAARVSPRNSNMRRWCC